MSDARPDAPNRSPRRLTLRSVGILFGGLVLFGAAACSAPEPETAAASNLEPDPDDDPVADSLVRGWIAAFGGMEHYWDFPGARFTLTTEMWDSVSGRLRRTRPRYVTIDRIDGEEVSRIERWEGDDFIEQGFDGDTAWAYLNGEPLPDTAKDAREALYVARDVWYWFHIPYKLRDPGAFLRYRGRDEDGRHVVAVQFGEGVGEHQDTWMYRFQDGRAVPVEINYVEEGKETLNRVEWHDLYTVDGRIVAERRVHIDEQGRVFKVIRTHDVEIGPEIDRALFRVP